MPQVMMTDSSITGPQLDITAPEHEVEIRIREDRKVIWVNVDGVCRLRICQIPHLRVEDDRFPGE